MSTVQEIAVTKPGVHEHEVHVTIRLLEAGAEVFKFKISADASLLELLQTGAERASVQLLPNAEQPLDRLHNIQKHDHVGPPIEDLAQTVESFVKQPHATHDFGIELVLAFRVNTRWAIAPQTQMSPKQILAVPAINLDYTQYTLYLPGSTEPLPLDTPIAMSRGKVFEAQRDGKYGDEPTCTRRQ